ncbi:MAG: transposase [Anaerolineae bacterium]
MLHDSARRHRRSTRLPGYDYTQAGAYFITMVTRERECLFGDVVEGSMQLSAWGEVALACWRAIPCHMPSTRLDAVVVMPNHVHGVLWIVDESDGVDAVDAAAAMAVGAQHAAPSPYDGAPSPSPAPSSDPRTPAPPRAASPPVPTQEGPQERGQQRAQERAQVQQRAQTHERAQHAAPLPISAAMRVTAGSLGAVVRSYKAAVARQINADRDASGDPVWQRNYYEHVVRDEPSLDRVRRYVEENPRRWASDDENPERGRP